MDWKIVRKIARDAIRHDRVTYARCHVLTTAHDNDRSFVLPDGRHYSPLIDTLEDRLAGHGVTTLSVARIISTIKGPSAYAHVVSPEGAFARALLTKRVRAVWNRSEYAYSRAEERIWGDILDRTGAKKVVGIMPSRELCVAARKRGVWVADMQHGVIAESHPWYGERFRSAERPEFLPHAFLVWDPGSAEVLDWTRTHGTEVRIVGNVWVSRFLRRCPSDPIVAPLQESAARTFARNGKRNILASLSWAEYNIPNGLISDELVEVIRTTQDRYNWFLRLHPNQLKGFATDDSVRFFRYFAQELEGYATWEPATYSALPLVLDHMDMHVTWSSSVCIEAAHFGIRSCLLNPRMAVTGEVSDYYSYYKAQGMIDSVRNTPETIHSWLQANESIERVAENYDRYDHEFDTLVDFLSH